MENHNPYTIDASEKGRNLQDSHNHYKFLSFIDFVNSVTSSSLIYNTVNQTRSNNGSI